MARKDFPRKSLRERVAERKAREAERPTTALDHLVDSVTPGRSIAGSDETARGEIWRGYAQKGGYILMGLSLIFLLIQMYPIVRGEGGDPNWTGITIFVFVFLFGRALVFLAKFLK